jgi:DnaJ-class molecular chaperone
MHDVDPYQTLGILSIATDKDIKEAFRKLARIHHPDAGGDPAVFIKIQDSYSMIGDPVKRAVFDMERRKSSVSDARKEVTQLIDEYLMTLEKRNPNEL